MTYAATVLADNPFIYLPLNETSGAVATDASGNARNGTYTGGVTLNQPGHVVGGGGACKLDGSTGYIACPSAGVPVGNAAWTQEIWALINTLAGTSVFAGWGTNTANEEPVCYFDASGHLFISTWATDTQVATLVAATWYHLVNSYDGTTQRGYVNGVFAGGNVPGTVATPASPAHTIGRNPNPSEFFAGITAQHYAAYATALSAARIQAHYQAGIGGGIASALAFGHAGRVAQMGSSGAGQRSGSSPILI